MALQIKFESYDNQTCFIFVVWPLANIVLIYKTRNTQTKMTYIWRVEHMLNQAREWNKGEGFF